MSGFRWCVSTIDYLRSAFAALLAGAYYMTEELNTGQCGSLEPRMAQQTVGGDGWYCLRTQPKHEHIAAAHLRSNLGLEVVLPRIRYKRVSERGPTWLVEAMFPSYFFVRFHLSSHLRQVQYTRGVREVVHFGSHWPTVSDPVIDELRARIGPDETILIADTYKPGDLVRIAAGPLLGLTAVVTRLLPGPKRVAVLLSFLGQERNAELPSEYTVWECPRSQQNLAMSLSG
jgi:transcriptional antiterminator RfaH